MSSYLLNRRGHYHVRVRIPADLAGIIPSTELVKSLKTRDRREAHTLSITSVNKHLSRFSSLMAHSVKEGTMPVTAGQLALAYPVTSPNSSQ